MSSARSNLRQHPLSAAFPAMSDGDYILLKDSIESIGVRNPITMFEGMVIDGWHRWRASTELGMDCPTQELDGVDPRDFVLAQNKARRHVTAAQMALATTAVYSWRPVGSNQHGGSTLSVDPPKSTAELAVIAGVHENTIAQAKAVQANAAREVLAAVKSGEIGLAKASAIAKLPTGEQAAAIARPLPKKKPPQLGRLKTPKEPKGGDVFGEPAGAGAANEPLTTLTEAESNAAIAHGDTDILELLLETQKELDEAQRQIEAANAEDPKAEAMKWQRIADNATRRQQEMQATLVEREAEIKRHVKALRRIGKLVGEEDPSRVSSAVAARLKHEGVAT